MIFIAAEFNDIFHTFELVVGLNDGEVDTTSDEELTRIN